MKALSHESFAGMPFIRSGFEHVVELAAGLALRGHRIDEGGRGLRRPEDGAV